AAMADALKDAKTVYADDGATQSEVNSAQATLQLAYGKLELVPAEKLQVGKTYVVGIKYVNATDITTESSAAIFYDDKAIVEVRADDEIVVSFFQTRSLELVRNYTYDSKQSDINSSAVMVPAAELLDANKAASRITVSWSEIERTLLVGYQVNTGTTGAPDWGDRLMRVSLDLLDAIELEGDNYLDFTFPAQTRAIDKDDLSDLVDEASKLKSANYTSSSFSKMADALTAAKDALGNTAATQSEVGTAYTKLNQAMAELVYIADLRARIADADKLAAKIGDYTTTTGDNLKVALAKAKTVLGNASATPSQVATAFAELDNAINKLTPLGFPVVGKFYQIKIKAMRSDDTKVDSSAAKYYDGWAVVEVKSKTSYRVSFFQTSDINLVQKESYTFDTSQSDDNAKAKLSIAPAGDVAKGTARCVTVDWKDVSRSLFVNYNINISPNPTPEWVARDMRMVLDLSSAKEMTGTSYLGFDFSSGAEIGKAKPADKTALKAMIDKAEKLNLALYTELSIATLNSALKQAKTVYTNANATQPAVDLACDELSAAINGMVLKPTSAVSKDNMTDGRYTVRVDFWKEAEDAASMANESLNKTAIIDVSGNSMTMSISTRPIGYLGKVTALQTLRVNGSNASVLLNNISIGGSSYPSAFSFPLPNKNDYHPVNFTMRPDIGYMSDGIGGRLRISWDTLQAGEGAALSGDTSVADIAKDVSNVERSAKKAEKEAAKPVVGKKEAAKKASNSMSDAYIEPAGIEAAAEQVAKKATELPWYAWTVIGVSLGALGAYAASSGLFAKKVAPVVEEVQEVDVIESE
ncbi:MAG: NEAT domain-containing protein, partial [Actinomycetia bacterium]|nr:NEAT domain-containing protein [Actinomycetes bacterium]